jgi:hypothetical protein
MFLEVSGWKVSPEPLVILVACPQMHANLVDMLHRNSQNIYDLKDRILWSKGYGAHMHT